jgi:hypothetical protein
MSPEEVNAATLREVSLCIEGALWRQEQAARLSLREAWYMAALTRTPDRLPSLQSLLGDSGPHAPQTPEEVQLNVRSWAAAAGLKLHPRAEAVTHG